MPFSVTAFQSEKEINGVNIKCASFKEFGENFKTCAVGEKLGSGFCRGILEPAIRNDKNATVSRMIIIDGDMSISGGNLIAPYRVHSAVKKMGYNHFLYTTWSHQRECGNRSKMRNKFRLFIETEEYGINDLKDVVKSMIAELKMAGVSIRNVKENNAWSQIWFDARREEDDGKYEYYGYYDGKVREHSGETSKGSDGESAQGDVKAERGQVERETGTEGSTLGELYENVRTGKEYHTSLRTISYQLVKDGMSKAHTKSMLQTLMNSSQDAGTERWLTRYKDIDRLVDGVSAGEEAEFDIVERAEREYTKVNIPEAPGEMGKLINFIYNNMFYQYNEIAYMCAIGSIAAIIGRKYNADMGKPMGLNVYQTLIAGTGVGKSEIKNYFNYLFLSGFEGKIESYSSFLGPSKVTGDKALHNAMIMARSRVMVIPEAGLVMQSKAGNQSGLMAFLLDVYSQSHQWGAMGESLYSSKEDSLGELKSPALTLICESTEDNLISAYRDSGAIENGYLPRMTMYKINERVNRPNRSRDLSPSEYIQDRYAELMSEASEIQSVEDAKVNIIRGASDVQDDYWEFTEWCNGESTRAEKEGREIDQHMWTRMAVKAVKYSAIASVWNNREDIGIEEWRWAKRMAKWEMECVGNNLIGLAGGRDSDMDSAVASVCKKLAMLAKGSNRKMFLDENHRDHKYLTYSEVKSQSVKLKAVREFNANYKRTDKTAFDVIMEKMVKEGAIVIHKRSPLLKHNAVRGARKMVLQIMSSFDSFYDMYDYE